MSGIRTLTLPLCSPSEAAMRRLWAWCLVVLFFGLLMAAVLIDPGTVARGGADQVLEALSPAKPGTSG